MGKPAPSRAAGGAGAVKRRSRCGKPCGRCSVGEAQTHHLIQRLCGQEHPRETENTDSNKCWCASSQQPSGSQSAAAIQPLSTGAPRRVPTADSRCEGRRTGVRCTPEERREHGKWRKPDTKGHRGDDPVYQKSPERVNPETESGLVVLGAMGREMGRAAERQGSWEKTRRLTAAKHGACATPGTL